jgi:glycosyltransferase involved in cell wall biosynthesis
MKKRVAIITNDTSLVGGLPTMVAFLHKTLQDSGDYEPQLISLATSANDKASVQIKSPTTWSNRPRVEFEARRDLAFTHFGVWGSELEFQRYRPRRELTQHLNEFDLLQFVVGSPPWVCVAEEVNRPIVLWTATTTRADRASQMRQGSIFRRGLSSIMIPVAERYEKRALELADRILVLSEYTRDSVAAIAGTEKVALAPCGVDTKLFHPNAESAKRDYILCVARLSDPRKNVRLLLDAYAKLRESLPSIPDLLLIGDPPSAEIQKHLQQMRLANHVHLVGPKQSEELAQLYRKALFFVLSSNEEGLAIVILEAMASGLPVVSTDCGGPATAIAEGETGFLTPVGNADALTAAMRKLLVDPALRERMGIEGRRVAEERFSLGAAGKVFLDTYDEVLDANGVSKSESRTNPLVATPVSKQFITGS